ncbi:MAG: 30S ribosomal protein S12 methylthiotransferase RimO [Clostridium sp.]|nr:30S ribosomal protein S12 methylthiotransferase RimO [Clostridium sp.]MCM1400155.1 30S ribosomal protein S12 methylthiotransferase RimO [Clostridium sp.]MCM1460887.1 30S ribosomal protein S12 methylthiotransferase RimO [Bacteroides sp.]
MNILMISLGCDKNLCDSEAMLGLLSAAGHNITNDEHEADAVVINTCSFIHDAMEESISTILEMAQLKREGLKYLIVTGCLAERYKDSILTEIPEIDACIGIGSIDKLMDVIKELELKTSGEDKITVYDDINRLPLIDEKRIITSGTFMAYLKIAEGCNKHCTYCVIPSIRGSYRSVPEESLLSEAEYLASMGIKELVLVAQECTCYGEDLYGKKTLPELLHKLADIDGIQWIRLLYCYPEEINDALIESFVTIPKLVHYIDMPLQHCEDKILKSMGRKTNKASIKNVINRLRDMVPDIAIRTTFITGFPGEQEEDHEALLAFINEMEFDRLGVFTYSRQEGTPADKFPNQVDSGIAEHRKNEIMELQQEISLDKNLKLIGQIMKVIVYGYSDDAGVYVGRTYKDAPDIDGLVFFDCDRELISGDIVDVEITEAAPYDLIGEIKYEFTE